MKTYDVIVIGSGCGMSIVEDSLNLGSTVALVDKGPLGGTCPNLGCIPSKILIFPADRLMELREAKKLGIDVEVKSIDFQGIMARMRDFVRRNQAEMRQGLEHVPNLGYYEGEGHFVDDHTIEVNGQSIRGEKIFIAAGSRPAVPPIKGLVEAGYLTNENVLQLTERPESLAILGGGAIAVEYGHFFSAMGTRVTMLELAERLVLSEEKEISDLLKQELGKRLDVYTGVQTDGVVRKDGKLVIVATERAGGKRLEVIADKLLVATGRKSNADTLRVENAGIEVDKRGYIKTNEFLETNKRHVFVAGDSDGEQMFTHVANREASVAFHNAMHGSRLKMDYASAPHAIYTYPEIASVGLTEENARKTHKVLIGRARFAEIATGEIMLERLGYAKAVVDAGARKILGFHIIGPYAPMLIQEVINAMASGGGIDQIHAGMHIHPAQTELIPWTFGRLTES